MSGVRRLFLARLRRMQAKRETRKNIKGIATSAARIERNQGVTAALKDPDLVRRGKRVERAILNEKKQKRSIHKSLKKQVPRKHR